MKHLYMGGVLAALLAISAPASAANLIVNGGFEQTDNGYSQTETPVGWTNIGHTDGVIAYSVFNTPAYEGSYLYDEGGYGDPYNGPGDGIEQTVSTVAGQSYALTFGLSGENVSGDELADVLINGSLAQQYLVSVDPSYGELAKPFTTYTIDFVAASSSTTIAFTTDAMSASFGNNDPLIDGVSLTGGGVPEPASWALMLAGCGLAGATMRQRSRKAATA